QNFPTLTSAVFNSGTATTTIMGTINSTANTTFTIQLFANDAADSSGAGEGQVYLGSVQVTTDGNGNMTFTFNTTLAPQGKFITATATDGAGNTSEFSLDLVVS